MVFKVFHRTWWELNPKFPNGLESETGRKTYLNETFETEEEARSFCLRNNNQRPYTWYKLSRKFEYEDT